MRMYSRGAFIKVEKALSEAKSAVREGEIYHIGKKSFIKKIRKGDCDVAKSICNVAKVNCYVTNLICNVTKVICYLTNR